MTDRLVREPRSAYNEVLNYLANVRSLPLEALHLSTIVGQLRTALASPDIRAWIHRDPELKRFRNDAGFQRLVGAADPDRFWGLGLLSAHRLSFTAAGFRTPVSLASLDPAQLGKEDADGFGLTLQELKRLIHVALLIRRVTRETPRPQGSPGHPAQDLSYCRVELVAALLNRGVSSIADVDPDWAEPSSPLVVDTAEELSANFPHPVPPATIADWLSAVRAAQNARPRETTDVSVGGTSG